MKNDDSSYTLPDMGYSSPRRVLRIFIVGAALAVCGISDLMAACCCGGGGRAVLPCPCSWDGSFSCPSGIGSGTSTFEQGWRASEEAARRRAAQQELERREAQERRARMAEEQREDDERAARLRELRRQSRKAAPQDDAAGKLEKERFLRDKKQALDSLKEIGELELKSVESAPEKSPAPSPGISGACLEGLQDSRREVLVIKASLQQESRGFLGSEYSDGIKDLLRGGIEKLARDDALALAADTERYLNERREMAQACAEAYDKARDCLLGCSQRGVSRTEDCLRSCDPSAASGKCLGTLPDEVSAAAERATTGSAIYKKFVLRFSDAAQRSMSASLCLGFAGIGGAP